MYLYGEVSQVTDLLMMVGFPSRLDCTYLAELLAKSKVAPKSSHTSLILCPQNITHLTTENPLVFEYVMKMYQDLADKSIEI